MRRLAALFSFLLIFAFLNTVLWFYHSRSINSSFELAKQVFAVKGIQLTYSDLYFNTFTFWRIKTTVENLQFTDKNGSFVQFDKVSFISFPTEPSIVLRTSSDIKYKINNSFEPAEKLIVPIDEPINITFKLSSFWQALRYGLFNSSAPNPFANIESINYSQPALQIMRATDKKLYASSTPSVIEVNWFQHKYDAGFVINIPSFVWKLANDYDAKTIPQDLWQMLSAEDNKIQIKIIGRHYFSEEYKKYLRKSKKQSLDISHAKADMFEFVFENGFMSTYGINLKLGGSMSSAGAFNLPFFDVKIKLDNYPAALEKYYTLHNKQANQLGGIKPLGIKQKNMLLELLQEIHPEDNKNLLMHLKRSADYPTVMINKHDAFKVINRLQDILSQ